MKVSFTEGAAPIVTRFHCLALICALALAACVSPPAEPQIGEDVPDEHALIASEAFRAGDRYFLRYHQGEDEFFVSGALIAPTGSLPENTDEYQLSHPQAAAAKDWEHLRAQSRPIPVLSIDAWTRFRDQVFADFMPTYPGTGVAVSFDRGDYFFFYDRQGRFRARRLIDKPAWYRVIATVELERYYQRWEPLFNQLLLDEGIEGRAALFNTGDLEAGALPFVFVNTKEKLIGLMRFDQAPEGVVEHVPGAHWLQSLWHFVGSHTYSIPLRPFSSATSLMTLLSDTAIEPARNLADAGTARGPAPPLNQGAGMDLMAWEQELDRRLERPQSRGDVEFLVDGDRFFPRFIDAVTRADDSVDLRAYIFDNDDVAMDIAALLKRRSREGIDVRILFDGLGTIVAGASTGPSHPEDHRPPLSIHQHLEQGSHINVRAVKNTWLMGDHVKTMVIDQRTAFLGGMNIGREYRYDWHDLMMEVSGPVVDEINREFKQAWAQAGWLGDFGAMLSRAPKPVNQHLDGEPLRLVYTRPGDQEIFVLQREAMRRAQSYIYIENAYFTDDRLLRELIAARHRGVDVRVIIPTETDQGMLTRNIALVANRMLAAGIRVYIYPGFTHTKAAVFDGWVCVGTANLDRLSLRINQEVNLASSSPVIARDLIEQLFEPDFARSTEMHEPFPEQWSDYLIELLGDYAF